MRIETDFDGGVAGDVKAGRTTITCDVRGQANFNVRVSDPPPRVKVVVRVSEINKQSEMVTRQGLIVVPEGEPMRALPLKPAGGLKFAGILNTGGRDFQLSARHPYGRDGLDRLLANVHAAGRGRVRMLTRGGRTVPVFTFGSEKAKRVHWLIGGEDAWETSSQIACDQMVRDLAAGRVASPRGSQVNVTTIVSPYSTTRPGGSYTTPDGRAIYGAATWGADPPPPEYALLRDEVERTIATGRLGLVLTLHSWQAAWGHTEMETILSAGDNVVEGPRRDWAAATLKTLMARVPRGRTRLAEKIWHRGLARDYLLAEHNTISFRVEVTTANQSEKEFRRTGRQILKNLANVKDWKPALG